MSITVLLLFLFAQVGVNTNGPPRFELHKTGAMPVAGQAAPRMIAGVVKSDADGNVYYQPLEMTRDGHLISPVIKVASDGNKITRYDIRATPEFQTEAEVADFAISADGTVHVLARKPNVEGVELYSVRFEDDGKVAAITRLDRTIHVGRFAAFSSGDLLVSGWRGRAGAGGTPFVGIVGQRGELIARVRIPLEEENSLDLRTNKIPDPKELTNKLLAATQSVDMSLAVPADDGTIYLMRHGPDGPVYAISPSGELVRTLHLQPPEKNAELMEIKVSHGRIAAMFVIGRQQPRTSGMPRIIISILDQATGEVLEELTTTDPKIGLSFAAFDGRELTFLGGDSTARMQLIKAAAQ